MYKNKKILAVVPARGGSKGIILKNLRTIQGIPLLGIVGNIIKKIKIFDRSIVSTDHNKIAKVAIEFGMEVPFKRPKDISGDQIGDIEVLIHALKETEKNDNQKYDIIVMLQPTSPLRKVSHVVSCIDKLIDEGYDAVWTVSENDSKNHPFKQLKLENGKIELYDNLGSDIVARQQLKPLYYRNGIAYALTRNCLLNQKRLMTNNTGAILINEPSISIDTQWDLELVDFILSKSMDNN